MADTRCGSANLFAAPSPGGREGSGGPHHFRQQLGGQVVDGFTQDAQRGQDEDHTQDGAGSAESNTRKVSSTFLSSSTVVVFAALVTSYEVKLKTH